MAAKKPTPKKTGKIVVDGPIIRKLGRVCHPGPAVKKA